MLNSTSNPTPEQSETIRAFHYRVYLAEATNHDKKAEYYKSIGQSACAKLEELRAAQCRAWAMEFAPAEVVAAQSYWPVMPNMGVMDAESVRL